MDRTLQGKKRLEPVICFHNDSNDKQKRRKKGTNKEGKKAQTEKTTNQSESSIKTDKEEKLARKSNTTDTNKSKNHRKC